MNYHRYVYPQSPIYWLLHLLIVAGIAWLAVRLDRQRPEGWFARFLRHPDRVWFGIALMLGPALVGWLLFELARMKINIPGLGLLPIWLASNALFNGLAGCLFATPPRRKEPINFWLAILLGAALIMLRAIFTAQIYPLLTRSFPALRMFPLSLVVLAVLGLACIFSREWRRKHPAAPEPAADEGEHPGRGRAESGGFPVFAWLLIGLLPIPVGLLLVMAHTSRPFSPGLAPFILLVCVGCNLLGGFGCAKKVENAAARIILGICLAVFLFILSVLVVAFEACASSGSHF